MPRKHEDYESRRTALDMASYVHAQILGASGPAEIVKTARSFHMFLTGGGASAVPRSISDDRAAGTAEGARDLIQSTVVSLANYRKAPISEPVFHVGDWVRFDPDEYPNRDVPAVGRFKVLYVGLAQEEPNPDHYPTDYVVVLDRLKNSVWPEDVLVMDAPRSEDA